MCLLGIACSMVFEFETVLAAEETEIVTITAAEEVSEKAIGEVDVADISVGNDQVTLTNEMETVTDPETQLIVNAQLEIANMGLSLEKYHMINVLGDSITEGVGASEANKTYPSVLYGPYARSCPWCSSGR